MPARKKMSARALGAKNVLSGAVEQSLGGATVKKPDALSLAAKVTPGTTVLAYRSESTARRQAKRLRAAGVPAEASKSVAFVSFPESALIRQIRKDAQMATGSKPVRSGGRRSFRKS